MKRILLSSLICTMAITAFCQTAIHINVSERYQTIRGFGASDAWNFDPVGKYWSLAVKEEIAQKLFSRQTDYDGNPVGIGLSRWRFNIGGGSSEQGDESNIENPERRAECFLKADGTYDWSKQSGQQWFLNKAKDYSVENLVAFVNSPPRYYTKSGRANSNDYGGLTNLKEEHFDDYVTFLSEVLFHFSDQGLTFSQISPVNEPQYPWTEGQEGSPWTNQEIKQITGLLNDAILNKGLDTKILIAEAESHKVLYQDDTEYSGKDDQINQFFNPSSDNYLGNYSQVLKGIASHGYWTDTSDNEIITVRENAAQKASEYGVDIYQTEYCLLSKDFSDYLTNSIYLGKMIHSELTIGNAAIYDYWTAIERDRWSQKNRFYLMRLHPDGGDYASLENGGSVSADKNLWVLGNYSYFIRPGYKRIHTYNAENLSGVMSSAFISPDESKIIVVHVNWGTDAFPMTHQFYYLPKGKIIKQITPYVTDANNNLKIKPSFENGSTYTLSGQSVTTMVVELEDSDDPIEDQTKQLILLSGETAKERVVYHDFLEWAISEDDKIPAWYVNQGNDTFTKWVNNPDILNINTSSTSLLAETKTAVDWWGNFLIFRLEDPIEITEDNRFLHILHYREHNNYGWSIDLNTESPYEDASTYLGTLRFDGDNSTDGIWEDIVIDMGYLIQTGSMLEKILVIVDKAWNQDKNSAPSKYYFDEIILSNTPLKRTELLSSIRVNPYIQKVNITYTGPKQICIDLAGIKLVEVYDISGRKIQSKTESGGPFPLTLQIPESGCFIIKITTVNDEVYTEKVLIK